MKFKLNRTQEKEDTTYKSLYIRRYLVDKIDQIARDNNTSWNNVVISMIESCLSEDE